MPFFSATRQWMVREVVVVECPTIDDARKLIDDESDEVITIAEVDGDPEIQPCSLQKASRSEIEVYKKRFK